MRTNKGWKSWREQNMELPFPTEFRPTDNGGLKVIRDGLESGWYGLYASFTRDADGNPVEGEMDEEAIGQPDYYSRNLTLLDEDALTQTLTGYM